MRLCFVLRDWPRVCWKAEANLKPLQLGTRAFYLEAAHTENDAGHTGPSHSSASLV